MSKIGVDISDDFKIKLSIDSVVTVMGDDSATGKQYLINAFRNQIKNKNNEMLHGITYDKLNIINDNMGVEWIIMKNPEGHLVFVDKVDILDKDIKKKLNDYINTRRNTWVLMTRSSDFKFDASLGLNRNSLKELKTDVVNGVKILHDVRV